jgi:bacteriocin-like protein
MKKINLKGISDILSEKELKNVMGGSEGTIDGYLCNDGDCYIDIIWSNGTVECGYPVPMVVCEQGGISC